MNESTKKSEIRKEVLTKGTFSSRKPTENSKCRVKIDSLNFSSPSSSRIDPNSFHSVYLNPISRDDEITIGDANSEIDECVEKLIQSMFVGEKSHVRITSSNIDERRIFIDFEITLTECEYFKPIWEWSAKEKYEVALRYKKIGVDLYRSTRIVEAFKKFSRACKILITMEPMDCNDADESVKNDAKDLRKILYNNMAECHLLRKNYEYALLMCDKVLGIDDKNVKATYRMSIAHENLKDYEKASVYMKKVLILEPKNSLAREKLIVYNKTIKEANKNYEDIVKKMFNA